MTATAHQGVLSTARGGTTTHTHSAVAWRRPKYVSDGKIALWDAFVY